MKAKYLCIYSDNLSIYSVKGKGQDEGSSIRLFYSCEDDRGSSAFRGKLAAELTNTGNGFELKFGNNSFELDFSEFERLICLIKEESWQRAAKDKVRVFRVK